MPYSGPDDKTLPENVKKMSAEMRNHWVGAFNGSMAECMKNGDMGTCEPKAFAIANGAVKKELKAGEKCTCGKDCKCGDMGAMMASAPIEDLTNTPLGPTTFEEMDALEVAQESAEAMDELTGQTETLVSNVMRSAAVVDKPSALSKIVDGLKIRLGQLMGKSKAKVTKTEGGVDFVESDYAVVPDAQMPSTWKLRMAEAKSGDFTVAQVGRAITAMQPGGFRGQKVELGPGDKKQAVSRISAVIGKLEADNTQKDNLRQRLDAVKERSYFSMTKDMAGDYRWFAMVSNCFRDSDDPPEIIESKAHKDFVDYLDKGGVYPELWLWHTPGTKFGKADWADYTDDFLLISGTVDKDKYDVAEKVAADADLGVSHGFHYVHSDKAKGLIGWYRTFEVSPLPHEVAANPWTGIHIIQAEAKDMNGKKRQFLVDKLGEDRVKALEAQPSELSKALKDAGIEYKEAEEKEAAPAPALSAKEIGEAAVKALTGSAEFAAMVTGQKAITDTLTALEARVKALERTDDEKIAAAIAPKSTAAKVTRATESKDNVIDKNDPLAKAGPETGWIKDALTKVLK